MGVATITLSGKTAVGRGGVSILSNVGLKEFIAGSPEEYMSIAERLAGDLPALEQMRPTLRGRLAASPLMDGRQFAADIESAYRQMWRIWCAKAQ
jgi:predicted O-linked N-acetylglucosamine transferase (SPINDLY family)